MSLVAASVEDPVQSNLPLASLLDDAQALLSYILNSSVAQFETAEPKWGTEANESSLILYCPIEGGEAVIDVTVHELARRVNAIVKTIDIVQLINGQRAGFWT
ncbi:hypothetical protein FRC11_013489, partial [Ceratobasidium sp. 423]